MSEAVSKADLRAGGEPTFDLVMVGSGLSSTFTLIRLLESMISEPTRRDPLRIAVVEKAEQFYTGLAYGLRSGSTSLIITPLDEFLPESELDDFLDWMARHGSEELATYRAMGGVRSADWLERVGPTIEDRRAAPFHVPRYLFGNYLTHRASRLREAASALGQATITEIRGEVVHMEREELLQLQISVEGGNLDVEVTAHRAVLAIGMPPTKELLRAAAPPAVSNAPTALLIDQPYEPGLDHSLDEVAEAIADSDDPHIVVIGANAGSLEMLYQLSNHPLVESHQPTITVISPQGRLPELFQDDGQARGQAFFEATQLTLLAGREEVAAQEVLAAVLDAVTAGRAAGFGVSDTLPQISAGVGALISKLPPEELQSFVNHEGVEIGQAQRRAGVEYCSSASDLDEAGRLEIVRGSFVGLEQADDGVTVLYSDSDTGDERAVQRAANVVVNCAGPTAVGATSSAPLINAVVTNGFCDATPSGGGFKVNDRMEAAPGVFVNGPLLAGNVIDGQPVWHVEHCGRIIKFSGILADHLAEEFAETADEMIESAAQPGN